MVLRPNLVLERDVVNGNEPALVGPIGAGRSEVWLGAALRDTDDKADGLDASVAEREDDIAGPHRAHVLVELIADTIGVPPWRPHEVPANFGPVRLVLVDPPVAHRAAATVTIDLRTTAQQVARRSPAGARPPTLPAARRKGAVRFPPSRVRYWRNQPSLIRRVPEDALPGSVRRAWLPASGSRNPGSASMKSGLSRSARTSVAM